MARHSMRKARDRQFQTVDDRGPAPGEAASGSHDEHAASAAGTSEVSESSPLGGIRVLREARSATG